MSFEFLRIASMRLAQRRLRTIVSDALLGLLDRLSEIEERGGPEPARYRATVELFDEIARHRSTPEDDRIIAEFRKAAPSFSTNATMHGFVCNRPYGCAGDFEIIERIYERYVSRNPTFQPWDDFFHSGDAAEAVRGRKEYCISLFEEVAARKPAAQILDIACGPCSDIMEFFSRGQSASVTVRCIDSDQNAVAFAQRRLAPYSQRVDVGQQNAFRANGGPYDLIWSAGLFDYLDDEAFVRLLRRMKKLWKPDGMIVIGNFGPNPVSKSYMEFGDWHLIYRSADQLVGLAVQAGYPSKSIEVDSERTGVNLFLRIQA